MNMSILRPKQYAKRANIDCVELVKLVKIHPGLWDNRNPSRHNRISLTENWIEVANALNQTEEVCRKKWKYLKDQYRKELRTELRSGPKFKSTWNVYEHMSFMKPYFKALLMANEEYKRVSNDEDCEEITESDGDFDEDDFDEEASEKSSLDSNTVDIRGLEDYMNKINSAPPFQESQNKRFDWTMRIITMVVWNFSEVYYLSCNDCPVSKSLEFEIRSKM
uniref:MADF domain-containing protein n=1 Tax=Megaselia scalaris TaxID=36166 RepID=T1GCA0_MEGSC